MRSLLVLSELPPVDALSGNTALTKYFARLSSNFSEIPSYDLVVPALLEKGIENLKEACSLTPGKSALAFLCFRTARSHAGEQRI